MLRQIPFISFLAHPLDLFRSYRRADLGPDFIAGISVGVILLPQAIAFSVIADLPAEMGLYAASVGAIVGALWGSSNQVHTGPANTTSLLVASVLVSAVPSNSPRYVLAACLLALMVGLFQLFLGSARLGMLVNFVAYSVILGFSVGSGILIVTGQIRALLGLPYASSQNFLDGLYRLAIQIPSTHLLSALIGGGTILLILLINKLNPKLPAVLISLVIASVVVVVLDLNQFGVKVIGSLPRGLPPVTDFPLFDLGLLSRLSTGALAIGALGMIQTAAISRSISAVTRQKLDNNQELVGQGLANVAAGLLSGYPISASFSRSGFNLKAGARTPIASVISGLFLLVTLLTLAPLAALIPLAAISGVLILTAINLIDVKALQRVWRGSREDSLIMLVTLFGTLFLRLDFAILTGILLSFAIYIKNTSTPRVLPVVPDENFRHLSHQPGKPLCPQLAIFDIFGDLYFGAVNHIEASIKRHMAQHPTQKYLLLRMQHVSNCDISGIQMLESIVEVYRRKGGDVFVVRVTDPVLAVMKATGFNKYLREGNFLDPDKAIVHLFYKVLDPAVCIYESNVRVFKECQSLARPDQVIRISAIEIPPTEVRTVSPRKLWEQLRSPDPPVVIDVREPREYQQRHIPQASLLPLPKLLENPQNLSNDQPVVLVCRSGRRSSRAAQFLQHKGFQNITILDGGLQAWENEGLLEAIEYDRTRSTSST